MVVFGISVNYACMLALHLFLNIYKDNLLYIFSISIKRAKEKRTCSCRASFFVSLFSLQRLLFHHHHHFIFFLTPLDSNYFSRWLWLDCPNVTFFTGGLDWILSFLLFIVQWCSSDDGLFGIWNEANKPKRTCCYIISSQVKDVVHFTLYYYALLTYMTERYVYIPHIIAINLSL